MLERYRHREDIGSRWPQNWDSKGAVRWQNQKRPASESSSMFLLGTIPN